jgi:hypothetical protein
MTDRFPVVRKNCDDLPNQFASKPQERLFEIVIGLGRDFKVLDAFLPVESHGSSLDLPLLGSRKGKSVR